MTLRPTIDKAGRFPVVQTPCPFQNTLKIDLGAPPAGILHTTEGGWVGSIGVFKQHWAPHFLLGLNGQGRAEIAQLVPIGYAALSCRAHNTKARVEIEMVGRSQTTLWLPDPETLDALASLMLVCRDEWGIPLAHPWPDGDFGKAGDNPHRHSGKLDSFAGWLGHGDMPYPDEHWDPGALEWSKVFARATQLVTNDAPYSSVPFEEVPKPQPPDIAYSTKWLQKVLNMAGTKPPLFVDGKVGPKTEAAILRFKSAHKLGATTVVDKATIALLSNYAPTP